MREDEAIITLPDDIATEDDLRAHKVAMEECARGEAIPHDAINWD